MHFQVQFPIRAHQINPYRRTRSLTQHNTITRRQNINSLDAFPILISKRACFNPMPSSPHSTQTITDLHNRDHILQTTIIGRFPF